MVIVESQPKNKKSLTFALPSPKIWIPALILLFTLTATATFAFLNKSQPTGSFLSPLPQTQQAQATPSPFPSPSTQTAQTASQLILTAQAYLEKAITVSQKDSQTENDRQQIIDFLNTSLQYANQAINQAPQSPQAYLVRARILASSQSIRQDALQLAQKDLETAQSLSGGQKVQLPTNIDLLDYTPTQQAQNDQDLVIAAPQDETTSSSAQTDSNVIKYTTTLPANQDQTTIENTRIQPDSYIYLISPSSHNIYLLSKSSGQATVATNNPPQQDLEFQYWIVNP